MIGKLPALWQKRRGRNGKKYGSYYATVGGDDINLGTDDPDEAIEALRGILMQKAAEASEPGLEELGAADTGNASGGTIPTAAPSSPAPAPAAAAASAPPLALPPVPPANGNAEAEARAEADATNAAAAETAGAGAEAGPPPKMSPEHMKGFIKLGATALVIGQIDLQAWIIKWKTGKEIPRIVDEKVLEMGADAWVAQFELWWPDIDDVPPWVMAVGAPLFLLPSQLAAAAQAPPAKEAKSPADPPVPVAA